jgi:hypothetical protein
MRLTATLLESLAWEHRTEGALETLLNLASEEGTAPLWLAYLRRTGRFGGPMQASNSANGAGDNRQTYGVVGEPENASVLGRAAETRLAVHRRELDELAEALDGLPWIALKGEPLSVQLYRATGLRDATDVDVLVAPGDLEEAVERLRGADFEGGVDDVDQKTSHKVVMRPVGGGLPVEVHWRVARPLIPAPDTRELLERREHVEMPLGEDETCEVPVLAPDDLLMQLAYHFHQHHGTLKGLADITAWLDRYGSERALSVRHGLRHRYGAAGLLDWALDALDLLTGARIGPGSDDPFVMMWARWSARMIERRYRGLEATPEVSSGETAGGLAMVDRLRQVARRLLDAGRGAMGMLALDRWEDKVVACARAGVLRPHRVGRLLME